jgi:hypothetical protein
MILSRDIEWSINCQTLQPHRKTPHVLIIQDLEKESCVSSESFTAM